MVAPLRSPLLALPKAWTPGTNGIVRAQAMRVEIDSEDDSEDDFDTYRGKLLDKILFFDEPRDVADGVAPSFPRHSEVRLEVLSEYEFGKDRRSSEFRERYMRAYRLRRRLAEFLVSEGAIAVIERSSCNHGLVRVSGDSSYEVSARIQA
jgi:carboxypeptidase Q